MGHQSSKNPDGPLPDFEVLVLHAVEQHEQVFIPRNEGVKLRVQVFEHGHSNTVFVVSRRCHEESMQQFVNDSLDVGADLQLVRRWQVQSTARLHGQLTDLWVLIVQEVEH